MQKETYLTFRVEDPNEIRKRLHRLNLGRPLGTHITLSETGSPTASMKCTITPLTPAIARSGLMWGILSEHIKRKSAHLDLASSMGEIPSFPRTRMSEGRTKLLWGILREHIRSGLVNLQEVTEPTYEEKEEHLNRVDESIKQADRNYDEDQPRKS